MLRQRRVLGILLQVWQLPRTAECIWWLDKFVWLGYDLRNRVLVHKDVPEKRVCRRSTRAENISTKRGHETDR